MSVPTVCAKLYIHSEPADMWTRIGRLDSAGRRSTWARLEYVEGPPRGGYFEGVPYTHADDGDVVAVEMCGGREGDDAFVRVERGDPAFPGLCNVVSYALDNIDPDEERAEWAARELHGKQMAAQRALWARGELGTEALTDPKAILYQRLVEEP